MLRVKPTFMSFVRSFSYKLCFAVGLATLAWQGASHLYSWIKPERVEISQSAALVNSDASIFQQKVDVIRQSEIEHVNQIQEHSLNRVKRVQAVGNVSVAVPVVPVAESGAVDSSALASPSPTSSPGVDAEGKVGEKTNTDGTQTPDANALNAAPGAAENIPYAQPLPMVPPYPYPYPPNSLTSSNAEVASPVSAVASPANDTVGVLTNAPGRPLDSFGNSGYSGYMAASGSSGSNSNPASNLSQQDVEILGKAIHASFAAQAAQITGMLCNQGGAGAGAGVCSRSNSIAVDTSRWDISDGLESTATFSVKMNSGVMTVQAGLTIQDGNLIPRTANLALSPTFVRVQNSNRGSSTYRTYTLNFPDTKVFGAETLTHVQATLVYQLSNGTMSQADSSFSFIRTSVTTVATGWDPTSTTRAPAQSSTPYIIADGLTFSMNLHN